MRWNEKQISVILIVLLVLGGLIVFCVQGNRYFFPKVPAPTKAQTTDLSSKSIVAGSDFIPDGGHGMGGRTNYRSKELRIDDSFTSNLPLVVIDTGDQELTHGAVWDDEKKYYVSTGEDPYAYGEIYIIDKSKGINQLTDQPAFKSQCKLKIRGNSSGKYDKHQYLIKLLDENGKLDKKNVLGMGKDSEWILNVSFVDKSLLRNYLAYTTAGELMPCTPDTRFCEVVWKDQEGYRYEGVYLMMESIKVGKNRVDLPKYSENSQFIPALLRRDRYNDKKIMLDNYGTRNQLTYGYLGIEYPNQENITEKGIQKITEQVDRLEQALYADSWNEFVKYRDYIDMQSFVDYFILNEFFLNYDAGYNSTYMYMNYSGKLIMGPVWDFDQAMDNGPNAVDVADLYTTAFHAAPWFDRILRDPVFTEAIIQRYAELRASILSDEAISTFLKETIDYLGPAIDRDWARWGYFYTAGNYLKSEDSDPTDRNTKTHQEEVDKILNVLSVHGAWMDERLDSLYQFKSISLEDASYDLADKPDYGSALAVVFVATFLISVKLVLKYESM